MTRRFNIGDRVYVTNLRNLNDGGPGTVYDTPAQGESDQDRIVVQMDNSKVRVRVGIGFVRKLDEVTE